MTELSRHQRYRQEQRARVDELEAQVQRLTALVPVAGGGLVGMTPDEQVVAKLESALTALTGADDLLTARDIRAGIQAVETWTKARRFSADTVRKASEVRVKADYHFGQMLRESRKSGGGRPQTGCTVQPVSTPTYAELGIEKTEAHRMQRLADATPEQFEAIVTQAAEAGEKLTLTRATKLVRKTQQPKPPAEPVPLPDGVFEIIYADPPWQDNFGRGTSRDVADHYATMPLEAIKALPVPEMSADDSLLFLWARSPMLPQALEVMAAWGFTYKASMVWHKLGSPGTGYYARVDHELLLIGTKGRPGVPETGDRPSSVQAFPKGEHSRKPDEFRALLGSMYPGRHRRVELFAREAAPNWTAWGAEVTDGS